MGWVRSAVGAQLLQKEGRLENTGGFSLGCPGKCGAQPKRNMGGESARKAGKKGEIGNSDTFSGTGEG